MTTDLDANDTSPTLLWFVKEMQKTTDPVRYKALYNHFRQGLDILDLDGIAYEMLGMNPNAMSHWLPELIRANDAHGFLTYNYMVSGHLTSCRMVMTSG